MHVREQLAQAIVARLTGLATTGARVFRRRPDAEPLDPDTEVPGLRIWTEGDDASDSGITLPIYERTTQMRVEAVVKKIGDTEGTLNAIASEVETAMGAQFALGTAQPFFMLYRKSAFQDSADGDQPVAVLTMRFEGVPITEHGAPDVAV